MLVTFRTLLQDVVKNAHEMDGREFFDWLEAYVEPKMQEIIEDQAKPGKL